MLNFQWVLIHPALHSEDNVNTVSSKVNWDTLMHDPERPDSPLSMAPVVASSPSLSPDVCLSSSDRASWGIFPLSGNASSARVALCHVSSLSIWAHLLLCFLGSRGWGGGHRSTVLNSLMQFNNAMYSFHVSLESVTCEIAKACLGWATRRSRGRVTSKRQMWEGERD